MEKNEIITFDGLEDKDRNFDLLKVITHADGGDRYRKAAMNYCFDDRCVMRKGYGVDSYDPQIAAMQFRKTDEYWNNEEKNPFIQYMHSYLKETAPTVEDAMRYTNEIMGPVVKGHLALTVAHEEDHKGSLYHTHTFEGTTNYNDGSRIYSDDTTNFDMAQRTAEAIHKPVKLIIDYGNGKEWEYPKIFVPHDDEDIE